MNRTSIALVLVTLLLAACGGYAPAYRSAAVEPQRGSYTGGGAEPAPEQRAGLATQWGESRHSAVSMTRFVRANPARPLAVATLHYDDVQGAAILAARSSGRAPFDSVGLRDPGRREHGVDVSLRDEHGRPLPAYLVGEHAYVAGQAGRRYSIVLENRTPYTLEAVVSVDGLDVIDGREASLTHRGYIMRPFATLSIDGFRQSTQAVAAFRFGSVASSYAAQTTGSARNVGVIGVALFSEAGAATPPGLYAEAELRERANPFPRTFAAPPPRY